MPMPYSTVESGDLVVGPCLIESVFVWLWLLQICNHDDVDVFLWKGILWIEKGNNELILKVRDGGLI